MLANERQKRIRELIYSHQNLKISDLSKLFNVSEMTIHRDIKPLIEEGIAEKTFGGLSLIKQDEKLISINECVICYRMIDDRWSCRIILANNKLESACCVHCALIRHEMLGNKVITLLCPDFFTHNMISAMNAWYVMETTIDISCCQPQLLAFYQKEHAERFARGFEGRVVTYAEARERIGGRIDKNKGCCQHG